MLTVLVPLSAFGVLLLSWRFAGAEEPGALDSVVEDGLVRPGRHVGLLRYLSDLGSPRALLVGILLLVLAALWSRRPWPVIVLAVAGPIASVVLTEFVLKPVVGRTHEGGLALPSGHTTTIASLGWVFVLVFVARTTLPWWWRAGLAALALGAVLGVAGSMVALDLHYFTDTVAGGLVATAVVGSLALLLDAWAGRSSSRHRPAA
jgi:membrane-associated phospholipid phosphatase